MIRLKNALFREVAMRDLNLLGVCECCGGRARWTIAHGEVWYRCLAPCKAFLGLDNGEELGEVDIEGSVSASDQAGRTH